MNKSKTLIEKQSRRKNDTSVVCTLVSAKKKENWHRVAEVLSGPKRKNLNFNLGQIDQRAKDGEAVVVPGKVLSQGEISKKVKVVALKFSERALEKISEAKCESSSLAEEIKSNPEAKNVRILEDKE